MNFPANIKIYDRDVLIYDCTLCKNPEGRIGWWDDVDGTFHDQTEHLLSLRFQEPMGTQYIDTGVKPENICITNADHIRSMTDEELAALLAAETHRMVRPVFDAFGYEVKKQEIYEARLEWLKQPYKEDT